MILSQKGNALKNVEGKSIDQMAAKEPESSESPCEVPFGETGRHLKGNTLHSETDAMAQALMKETEQGFKEMTEENDKSNSNKNSIGNNKDRNSHGNKIVCKYFLEGRCRFGEKCFNYHDLAGAISSNLSTGDESTSLSHATNDEDENLGHNLPKSYEKKKNSKIVDNEKGKKKPAMKTATDVINRIQWDEKLNPEDFTVGYLDRFMGIIENSYSSFDWEDITSVDQSVLAIPRHRIQYFKYRDEVVWDKNKRLDCVFGSTGSGQTILDVMERIEQEKLGNA